MTRHWASSTSSSRLDSRTRHPERSSALARGAETILAERQKRWPDSRPPIAPNELEFLIGMLEMNAGHAAEAQQRFEKSIEKDPDPAALTQLGLLLERTGHPKEAEQQYPSRARTGALRLACQ